MTDFDRSKITIRPMVKEDLKNGFLECVNALRKTSLDADSAGPIFDEIAKNPNHKIFVAIYDQRIIGTTTLIIEPKFIHNGGYVCHSEDTAVLKEFQGQSIGTILIKYCLSYAKNFGCYKTILDCPDHLLPWYTKLGKKNGRQIRFDHK